MAKIKTNKWFIKTKEKDKKIWTSNWGELVAKLPSVRPSLKPPDKECYFKIVFRYE